MGPSPEPRLDSPTSNLSSQDYARLAVANLVSKGHPARVERTHGRLAGGCTSESGAWHGLGTTLEIAPGRFEVILIGVAGCASRWAGGFFSLFTLPWPTAELVRTNARQAVAYQAA